jgi:ABC-type polysaccharide/polyol phosphate export permease
MLADIRKRPDYREPIVNPMAAIIESYRTAMLGNQTPDRFLNLS